MMARVERHGSHGRSPPNGRSKKVEPTPELTLTLSLSDASLSLTNHTYTRARYPLPDYTHALVVLVPWLRLHTPWHWHRQSADCTLTESVSVSDCERVSTAQCGV